MALTGALMADSAGDKFAGPVNPTGEVGLAWRARNVSGNLAAGEVALYAPDGTALLTVSAGTLATGSVLAVGLTAFDGSTQGRLRTASFVADGQSGAATLSAGPVNWNGATYDKQRGNWSATVLASAARTVATSTGALVNYNGRGIQIDLSVTAKAVATTMTIQLLNPGGATIATSGTIAAAAGQSYSVIFYPGILAASYTTNGQGLQLVVPRDYILVVTPSDANSVTYSCAVQTLL